MSGEPSLRSLDMTGEARSRLGLVLWLLPVGWALIAVGYYGPWIAHAAAGLTLTGADMGEFVKFLPTAQDGSLQITRQWFYLPPCTAAVSLALLVGSRRLRYPWLLRALFLVLAVPVSLQLLPPAWSPASLRTEEFRLQAIALGFCWLMLASFWGWGRLPARWTGLLAAALALATAALCVWQFWLVKPAIDEVYGGPQRVGWGCYVCLAGLAVQGIAGLLLVWRGWRRRRSAEL